MIFVVVGWAGERFLRQRIGDTNVSCTKLGCTSCLVCIWPEAGGRRGVCIWPEAGGRHGCIWPKAAVCIWPKAAMISCGHDNNGGHTRHRVSWTSGATGMNHAICHLAIRHHAWLAIRHHAICHYWLASVRRG